MGIKDPAWEADQDPLLWLVHDKSGRHRWDGTFGTAYMPVCTCGDYLVRPSVASHLFTNMRYWHYRTLPAGDAAKVNKWYNAHRPPNR
jgi:hypothetical protein